MNENINLCEILKGHEGETFYSSAFGKIILKEIYPDSIDFYPVSDDEIINTDKKGIFLKGGEIIVFPSKDQRNWEVWDKENNHKTPKTWSELVNSKKAKSLCIHTLYNTYLSSNKDTISIEKSALALLKIYQLIEVGYGGNVSKEEFFDERTMKFIINLDKLEDRFHIYQGINMMNTHIAFHSYEQAEEFLSYPENVQLLRDYFMI